MRTPVQSIPDRNADGLVNQNDITLDDIILSVADYAFSIDLDQDHTFYAVHSNNSGENFEDIKSGVLEVDQSGANYEIIIDCRLENAIRLNGYFKGKIERLR